MGSVLLVSVFPKNGCRRSKQLRLWREQTTPCFHASRCKSGMFILMRPANGLAMPKEEMRAELLLCVFDRDPNCPILDCSTAPKPHQARLKSIATHCLRATVVSWAFGRPPWASRAMKAGCNVCGSLSNGCGVCCLSRKTAIPCAYRSILNSEAAMARILKPCSG